MNNKEKVKSMRITNLKMVKGLVDLADRIKLLTNGKPLEFIEVGSYIGESTNIFLNNLNIKTIVCIDAWASNEKYHEKDINEALQIFKYQFKNNPKVGILQALSTSVSFDADVVYIDASHKYEDILEDIKHWYPKCQFICGHDYESNGKFGVKQAVDEFFADKSGRIEVFEDTSWLFIKK